MDSNSTRLCRLCLQQSDDVVNIFDNFENTTIASILTQHFWFLTNDYGYGFSEHLCQICWINTKTFHIFYKAVELVQKDYWQSAGTDSPFGVIKQERSDTELELDLSIVKAEEPEPVAQLSYLLISKEEILSSIDNGSCDQSKKSSEGKDNDQSLNPKRKTDCFEGSERKKLLRTKKKEKSSESEQQKDFEDAQIREYFRMECEICSDPFETFREAKKHFRDSHKTRGYLICCSRKFFYRTHALSHINFHLNPDAIRCDQCGRRFAEKKLLRAHMENHAPDSTRAFKCDFCPLKFMRESKLLSHKQFVHCPVKCDECGMSYPSKSKLTTHMKNVHQSRVKTPHVCDICGKDFASKVTLSDHVQAKHSTTENPKFQCDICGSLSTNKRDIWKHLKLHHEQTATCSICNKVMQNKSSLAKHVRYVHREKRHRCTICDKKFRTRFILKEHIAGHTGQALYKCAYCTKTFNSAGNLCSHRKKIHPAEWKNERLSK